MSNPTKKSLPSPASSSVLGAQSEPEQHVEDKQSVFDLSDEQIERIFHTRVYTDGPSEKDDSLFIIVKYILKRSIQIIDNLVPGNNVHVGNIEEKKPQANFTAPLSIIKSIGSELSCEGDEVLHKTVSSIIDKTSRYKWGAKALLALAAFAYDFGDVWHLANHSKSDHMAKQFASLKNVDQLIKTAQKYKKEVQDLCHLINYTIEIIALFDEFEKLSAHDVYWTIATIVALANNMSKLISEKPEKPFDLCRYAWKINSIRLNLTQQLTRKTIIVGPWGGPGGSGWDDRSYTGIREIELSYKDAIRSFSVIYDSYGKPFPGPKHTSKLLYTNVKIELEFPHEYLVSVSGYTAPLSLLATRTPVIRSLKFETNKGRTFGPYGEEDGTPFNLPIENGFIVGFKGRSGDLLDAIGVHLAP